MTAVEPAVRAFWSAVESRDLDTISACFTEDATYANVPHPPARGRAQIRAMFAPIVSRATRIAWQIRSFAVSGDIALAERVDRFWIDGRIYQIECTGVYRVDQATGLVAEVRDYVDLAVWRARLGGVLERTP